MGTWMQEQVLEAPNSMQKFGHTVELFGNVLTIGAPGGFRAGGFQSYNRDDLGQWIPFQAISEGTNSDRFGSSISLAAQILAVGAFRQRNENGNQAGAVYLFDPICGLPTFNDNPSITMARNQSPIEELGKGRPDLVVYPNPIPIDQSFHVGITSAIKGTVEFTMMDAAGKIVENWTKSIDSEGYTLVTLKSKSRLASGSYFLRARSNGVRKTVPVIVTK
jgi:hypothetical protein